MTPSGIEPATFRFVAQHLNHCAIAVPIYKIHISKINNICEINQKCDARTQVQSGIQVHVANTAVESSLQV